MIPVDYLKRHKEEERTMPIESPAPRTFKRLTLVHLI